MISKFIISVFISTLWIFAVYPEGCQHHLCFVDLILKHTGSLFHRQYKAVLRFRLQKTIDNERCPETKNRSLLCYTLSAVGSNSSTTQWRKDELTVGIMWVTYDRWAVSNLSKTLAQISAYGNNSTFVMILCHKHICILEFLFGMHLFLMFLNWTSSWRNKLGYILKYIYLQQIVHNISILTIYLTITYNTTLQLRSVRELSRVSNVFIWTGKESKGKES